MAEAEPTTEIRREFEILDRELIELDKLYYGQAESAVSDQEYDAKRRRWKDLQNQYPLLKRNAKGARLGDDRQPNFRKIAHLKPMLSLGNTYNRDELLTFLERIEKKFGQKDFVLEPKIDGAGVTLIYRQGKFDYGLSRGNGIEGDDVSQNLLTSPTIPQQLSGTDWPELLEVRGEIFIRREDFLAINRHQEAEGFGPYANARNLAAGTLKVLDSRIAKKRHLQFIAYEIGRCSADFATHTEVLESLIQWGLPANRFFLLRGFDAIWKRIEELDQERKNYDFETDGAVIKLNDRDLREELGAASTAPRWAIAYKYNPETAITRVEAIQLNVGRTGIIAPVAILQPVRLSGSVIRHATLHNANEIRRKDVRVGDYVTLQKAGEIIPAIVQVCIDRRAPDSIPYRYPTSCPACNSPLVRIEGEVAYRCLNADCPPQIRRRIEHFVSKSALNIEQLGPKIIEQLLNQSLIQHVADIFALTKEQLMTLPHTREQAATRLYNSIQRAKKQPFWRLIHGLGIPHVGAQTAKLLSKKWKNYDALAAATMADLEDVNDIGSIVAASIHSFIHWPKTELLINQLRAHGLMVEEEVSTTVFHPDISGKNFVITGTFPWPRDRIKSLIEACGGQTRSTVSRRTDALLCGQDPGSKREEAERLQLPIYGVEKLEQWLADGLNLG